MLALKSLPQDTHDNCRRYRRVSYVHGHCGSQSRTRLPIGFRPYVLEQRNLTLARPVTDPHGPYLRRTPVRCFLEYLRTVYFRKQKI